MTQKSNYPFPDEWRNLDTVRPFVRAISGPGGTAAIFTEAMVGGSLPCHGIKRRTVFYEYGPNSNSFCSWFHGTDQCECLSDRRREMLVPSNAYYGSREGPRRNVRLT